MDFHYQPSLNYALEKQEAIEILLYMSDVKKLILRNKELLLMIHKILRNKKLLLMIHKITVQTSTTPNNLDIITPFQELVNSKQISDKLTLGIMPRVATRFGKAFFYTTLAMTFTGITYNSYNASLGAPTPNWKTSSLEDRVYSMLMDIDLGNVDPKLFKDFKVDGDFNMTKALLERGVHPSLMKNYTEMKIQYEEEEKKKLGAEEEYFPNYVDAWVDRNVNILNSQIKTINATLSEKPQGFLAPLFSWLGMGGKPKEEIKNLEDQKDSLQKKVDEYSIFLYESSIILDAAKSVFARKEERLGLKIEYGDEGNETDSDNYVNQEIVNMDINQLKLSEIIREQNRVIESYDHEIVEACFVLKKCDTKEDFLKTLKDLISNHARDLTYSPRKRAHKENVDSLVRRIIMTRTIGELFTNSSWLPFDTSWLSEYLEETLASDEAILYYYAFNFPEIGYPSISINYLLFGLSLATGTVLTSTLYFKIGSLLSGSTRFPIFADEELLSITYTNRAYRKEAIEANKQIQRRIDQPAVPQPVIDLALFYGSLMFNRMVETAKTVGFDYLYVEYRSVINFTNEYNLTPRGQKMFDVLVKLVQAKLANIIANYKLEAVKIDAESLSGKEYDDAMEVATSKYQTEITEVALEFGPNNETWGPGLNILKLEELVYQSRKREITQQGMKLRPKISNFLVRGIDNIFYLQENMNNTLSDDYEVPVIYVLPNFIGQLKREREENSKFPHTITKIINDKPVDFLGGYYVSRPDDDTNWLPILSQECEIIYSLLVSDKPESTGKYPSFFLPTNAKGRQILGNIAAVIYYENFKTFVKMWTLLTVHYIELKGSGSNLNLTIGNSKPTLKLDNQ